MTDPIRKQAQTRLKRIAGQVTGLEAMVSENRYCGDVLQQIASVQEALRGLARLITRDHLEHCVTNALRTGDPAKAQATYDELMNLVDLQKR